MPNGGPDNCAHCRFRSNPERAWRLEDPLQCTIRNVAIANPPWTYCANLHTKSGTPDGPIFIAGIEQFGARLVRGVKEWAINVIDPWGRTYVRIPCHHHHFPTLGRSGVCCICSRKFEGGIEVEADTGEVLGFCGNQHYMDWWKASHPNEELAWEYEFDDPVREK